MIYKFKSSLSLWLALCLLCWLLSIDFVIKHILPCVFLETFQLVVVKVTAVLNYVQKVFKSQRAIYITLKPLYMILVQLKRRKIYQLGRIRNVLFFENMW